MITTRLGNDPVSHELLKKIDSATDAQKRAIAAAVATLAVRISGLKDPTVEKCLQLLQTGPFGPSPITASLRQIAEDLDHQYLDAHDKFESGQGDKAIYKALFAKARAADALVFALEGEPFKAASESTYGAGAAIGYDDLRPAIEAIFR